MTVTNIKSYVAFGKKIINLVEKDFNKNNKLSKILDRYNIQLSYSCTANLKKLNKVNSQSLLNKTIKFIVEVIALVAANIVLKGLLPFREHYSYILNNFLSI